MKKIKQPSTAQKIIESSKPDNQYLFDHVIELNSKIDRLAAKHKKLKKRYLDIQSDLYVSESDVGETVKDEGEEKAQVQVKDTHIICSRSMNSHVQPVNRSWRSRLTYL